MRLSLCAFRACPCRNGSPPAQNAVRTSFLLFVRAPRPCKRHVLWYRKEFKIPAPWKGDTFWLDFEGVFRNATVWINGKIIANHVCGYTPFRVRLDNITNIEVGGSSTIAIFVDPDNGDDGGREHGSGWWYEGGGL